MCPQLCYEMCTALLAHKVAHEAVRAYKDGRSFAPEVVTMLQNSLAEEDHAVSQSHIHADVHTSLHSMYLSSCMTIIEEGMFPRAHVLETSDTLIICLSP